MGAKNWTKSEERKLEEIFMCSDYPVDDAVKELDRSRSAIRGKAYQMGLTGMYKKDKEDKKFTDAERWGMWNKIINKAKELRGMPTTPASENPYRKSQEV